MNPESLLAVLVRLTLLFSAGVLLLALLRPLLLRGLGARATYAAWLLVPLLMASPWLPRAPLPAPALQASAALPVTLAAAVAQALPATPPAQPAPGATALNWLLAWTVGALWVAAGQVASQRRYLATLRRETDGSWLAPVGASPAVVGIWPQRLVLPQDFEQRFDGPARRLVLAHEAVHARRHDNAWNLLGALLLCLQWFNPLAWWGWRRLRDDQELACDAAVLAREPGPAAVASYARAMLAAHPVGTQPALASGWATRHPLVQRMRMLARHRKTSRWQHVGGMLLVLGLSGSVALLARAAQEPAPAGDATGPVEQGMVFEVASQLTGRGWHHSTLRLPTREPPVGGPWGVTLQAVQPGWCLNVMLHVFDDGSLRPTGQVLDETCQYALSDWQALKVNGSVAQFAAQTAQGALQAQLSARWVRPDDPALPALMKAELDAAPRLSPAQQQLLARQRQRVAEVERQQQALDRAWREARQVAPR